jgi:hypothetical protein
MLSITDVQCNVGPSGPAAASSSATALAPQPDVTGASAQSRGDSEQQGLPDAASVAASEPYVRTIALDANVKASRYEKCATATLHLQPRLSAFYGKANAMVAELKKKLVCGLSLSAYKKHLESSADELAPPSLSGSDAAAGPEDSEGLRMRRGELWPIPNLSWSVDPPTA